MKRAAQRLEAAGGASTGEDVGRRLQALVEAELATAAKALRARGGRIHAGVHEARKAMRRARSALRLAGTAMGAGTQIIERELRKANKSLGRLRDAHALVETIDRLGHKLAEGEEGALLRRAGRIAAAQRAVAARDRALLDELAVAREALGVLQAALAGLPWERVTASLLLDALEGTGHEVEHRARLARASMRDADWHRWRRWMRRQSQQRRALVALGVDVQDTPFDKSLAEQLGVMQDLDLLISHCGPGSIFAKPDRKALRRIARKRLVRQRERIASVTGPEDPSVQDAD